MSPSRYFQADVLSIPGRVSDFVRRRMFKRLMEATAPGPKTSVLDVGVSCERRKDSNFFEKLYPFPHRITAVGMEDCSFLQQDYPGLKFLKADGTRLPFADKSFDLAVSFATLEHVGTRERQEAFLGELCRVSRVCCVTTPNRWYPLEFHTFFPLIHWLPPRMFRAILFAAGHRFFVSEDNLNLLSARNVMKMLGGRQVDIFKFRLLGPVSNLMFLIKNERKPDEAG